MLKMYIFVITNFDKVAFSSALSQENVPSLISAEPSTNSNSTDVTLIIHVTIQNVNQVNIHTIYKTSLFHLFTNFSNVVIILNISSPSPVLSTLDGSSSSFFRNFCNLFTETLV